MNNSESNQYIIDNVDVRLITQPIIHKENDFFKVASTKLQYLIDNNINNKAFKKPKELLIIIVSNYKIKHWQKKA